MWTGIDRCFIVIPLPSSGTANDDTKVSLLLTNGLQMPAVYLSG